jgi:ABC-type antimicrobial peptide transport system permease subunit
MNNAGFPINDLLRRKLQTSLTIATLTLSVASTLFLLQFSNRLGLGFVSSTGTLTLGLAAIFSQFILFIGILIFAIGAVLTSFIVFLMMAQRTRDFGLIKAAGCPNSLVAGYFLTELLIVTFVGCVLGIIFGFLMDFVVSNIFFSSYAAPNFWFAPLVFVVFFVLAFFFGLQPLLKASRVSAVKALSAANYFGLTAGSKYKALSRSALTWRIATRSLSRRPSATIRIVFLLSIVFVLLTVSVAGGIIANQTTTSWVEQTVDKNTIAVASNSMGNEYKLLLTKFSGVKETGDFNFSNPNFGISNAVIEQLSTLQGVTIVDSRLVTKQHVAEVANFTIDPSTLSTFPIGDSREGESIIVGVNPQKLASQWSTKGQFLSGNESFEAVIGDSISQTMYSPHPSRYVVLANPLLEAIKFQNSTFNIVGVCVDPLNNGFVTYVPIDKLENATGISNPNLLLIKLNNSANRETVISEIKSMVQAANPDLNVFDLGGVVNQNLAFMGSTWQTIMLLPLFTLASAALCVVGYMMLAIDEQRQEFGILRAVGAKPRIIINSSTIQGAIVLFSSFAVGISFGLITTLVILMTNPLVTILTIVEIALWLFAALVAMFILSLYPAFRLAKTSILKVMA